MDQEEIQLADVSHRNGSGAIDDEEQSESRGRRESQSASGLAQADGGRRAWMTLGGCFCIEALIWGFPFSYGIFEEYYKTHQPFSENASGVAAVGTSATGLMYFGTPFVALTLQRYPRLKRSSMIIGAVIAVLGLIMSSFASKVWHLVMTQGLMYGAGGILMYTPGIFYLDEWFIRRKGLAYGLMWAGTGTGGVIIPLVLNLALDKYGLRTVLRAWAIFFVLAAIPIVSILKPRLPLPRHSGPRPIDKSFLRSTTFWVLLGGNILESFGYFIPTIYIPSYARTLDLPALSGPAVVSLSNFTSSIGAIAVGLLIDRLRVTTVILISTVGTTVAVFLCWGLAVSLPALCIFAALYGLFAGGYSVTWSACVKEVQRGSSANRRDADVGILVGIMAAGRGVGSVCSGPLSELLLSDRPWSGQASLGYGTGYGSLIVFTGLSALLGGVSCLVRVPKIFGR